MTSFSENEYEMRWEKRFEASKVIRKSLSEYPRGEVIYDEWHKTVIKDILDIYEERIRYGQAQKWLNMTVKYLFVFDNILSESQKKRLADVSIFLEETDVTKYKVPVDSYVMKACDLDKAFGPWSQMNDDQYAKLQESLKKDFMWELENWVSIREKYKEREKKSYEAYYEKRIQEDM
ncbi:MAG: hypothetical protein K5675_00595 [Lachnospiraceae bacterium]|nr:hypothetical protein [Lachnospiraceae bacterium]